MRMMAPVQWMSGESTPREQALQHERDDAVQHLYDAKQVYEMELSELRARLSKQDEQIVRLQRDNRFVRGRAARDREDSENAREMAREAAGEARENERLMRAASLREQVTQRQLAKFRDFVPLAQFEEMRDTLRARVAELQEQLTSLQDLLPCEQEWEGEHEGEGEGGEGEGEGEGDVEPVGRVSPVDKLRESVGVEPGRQAPAREHSGDRSSRNWEKRSVRHITAVLRGRPMAHIVTALSRLGRLTELAESAAFAGVAKQIVRGAVKRISDHWTPRMAVHIWDRMELSREKMETLRHLLSFIYDPLTDRYNQLKAWVHPTNPADFIAGPCLAGRHNREKLVNELADACEICVGDNGRCERDAVKCASQLYSNFRLAMRTHFSPQRPARPIFLFDGTGGALGKGICHAELGSADFAGECSQSRATLSPLACYEGNDHALPLRANLQATVGSFNNLIKKGVIERDDQVCLPCEPVVVGDMQGLKCMMGMTESCHSVWCKCRARAPVQGEGPQHKYGDSNSEFKTYDEMLAFYEQIGCEFKSEDFILACAHLKGCCPECGYKPSAAKRRSDLAQFNAMTDEEQAKARKEHVKLGRHWHVELFMGPMVEGIGMLRCGSDQLHLVYLNFFKHLFKYTIHEPLPVSKKKIVQEYLKAAHFYSYDAAADDDDPVSRWIGREVKRFLHEADQHLPFLLSLSSGVVDVCAETAARTNAAGEEEMDVTDDEFEPTDEQVRAEEVQAPLIMKNADRWDRFLDWVRELELPWDVDDSDDYRKSRAVRYCNRARACSRDLLELKPTMSSWVPHIACNIAPRQIVALGDPRKRSADACESFGACTKKVIKLLTNHRQLSSNGKRGYVEQAFRRMSLRANLIHGEDNAPYLQRSDAMLLGHGRKNNGRGREEGPHLLVRVKVQMEMDKS